MIKHFFIIYLFIVYSHSLIIKNFLIFIMTKLKSILR